MPIFDKLQAGLNAPKPTKDDFTTKCSDPSFPKHIKHNSIGPIHFNDRCKTATILEKNNEYINVKCIDNNNNDLFYINDKHDHFESTISNNGQWVAFTRTNCGIEELCIYSVKDNQIILIDNKPGGYSHLTFNDQSTLLEYKYSNVNQRGNVYCYDINKRELIQKTNYQYPLNFNHPEIVRVGDIPVLCYKPEGYSKHKKHPAIIKIGNAHEPPPIYWSSLEIIYHLAGYILLKPCIRGKMGNGTDHLYSISGKCGILDVEDIISVAQGVKKLDFIEKNDISILGESFGGFLCAKAITQYPSIFKKAILIAGVYDLEDFAKSRSETWNDLPYSFYFGHYPDIKSHLIKLSPLNDVDKIETSLLIVHGKSDTRSPYRQAQKFIEKCEAYNKDYLHYSEFNTHGHNDSIQQKNLSEYILKFLTR